MSSDQGQLSGGPKLTGGDEPPCYCITLYTRLTDEPAAVDLALRVADIVGSIPEIDKLATTVSQEEHPAAEPVRVFVDLVK